MGDLISKNNLVKQLKHHKELFCRNRIEFLGLSKNDKARVDEIDNCIATVINMPSAHSEIEERKEESAQNVPKEDLISRKSAIDAMSETLKRVFPEHRQIAEKCLNVLPSAQPEIIRCKDCRWRKDQSGSTAWLPCRAIVTPSDFYCGRAERRTDGIR